MLLIYTLAKHIIKGRRLGMVVIPDRKNAYLRSYRPDERLIHGIGICMVVGNHNVCLPDKFSDKLLYISPWTG